MTDQRAGERRLAADLAVAVPTVDRPAALARCLDAILAGERLPGEVVVIDQGGGAVVGELLAARRSMVGPRLIHVVTPQRGLSAARNAAISASTTRFVAFTDDDCVPDAGWLAAIERVFLHTAEVDAVTGRVLPWGDPRPGLHPISTRSDPVRREYRGVALPWRVGSGGNIAVRRDRLLAEGGFDERLGAGTQGRSAEDMDIIHRLLRSGAIIRYEPAALVYHERQDTAHRLASRTSYGFGMGAFCAIWIRRGDRYALRILGSWTIARVRLLFGAIVRRRRQRVHEELLYLAGAAAGVLYGLRLGGKRPESASLDADRRTTSS